VDDRQAEKHVRAENEISRLTAELAHEFEGVSPDTIEHAVRSSFEQRSSRKVQDFVSIFVERDLRHALRDER